LIGGFAVDSTEVVKQTVNLNAMTYRLAFLFCIW